MMLTVMQASRTTIVGLTFAIAAATLVACGGNDANAGATSPTPTIAAIRIQPATMTIVAGSDSQAVAIVTDAAGRPITNADVRWSMTDGAIISVSGAGVIHAISPGVALVTAVDGPRIALDTVTVIARSSSPNRRARGSRLQLASVRSGR